MLNTSRNYIGDKIYLLVVFPSFYLIDDDNNVDDDGHNDNSNDNDDDAREITASENVLEKIKPHNSLGVF